MTLQIAGDTYAKTGRRDDDFHRLVGYNPIRAAQVVDALLDRPDAEAEMPQVVHRLKALRVARQRQRWYARPVGVPVSRST